MSSVASAKRDPPGPESTEQNWEWGRRAWSQPRLKQRGNGRSAAGSILDTEKGALAGKESFWGIVARTLRLGTAQSAALPELRIQG